MNYAAENTATGWDFFGDEPLRKESIAKRDIWKRCDVPFRQSPPEESESHAEALLLKYIRAYLETQAVPCNLGDTWRELQQKWEPYIIHLTGASTLANTEKKSELEEI